MASDKPRKGGDESEPRRRISTRRPFLYLFSVLVLVIIIVAFVGAPLVTQTAQRSESLVFGSYRGETIEYTPGSYFARQYESAANRMREEGENMSTQEQMQQVWRQAFNQTLFHTAVMYEARQSNIAVSESRVDRELAQQPQFQENGRFDPQAFQNTSSQERFNLRQFLRESIVHQHYVGDKLQRIKTSPESVEFVKSMASPERQFNFVAFEYDEYPDEEVRDFAQEKEDLFRRIDLSVITVPEGESQAQNIREQIAERTNTFEELARAHSADQFAENGGDMGSTYFYELEGDFADSEQLEEVFSLEEGELSPVLEGRNGWIIYRVDEAARNADLENEDTLDDVRSYLNSFERGRVEDYMTERAEEFRQTASESNFSEAASAEDLSVRETGYFPINYGNVPIFGRVNAQDYEALSEAASRERFFEETFALEENEVSNPIALENALVVMQFSDEREAAGDSVGFLDNYYPYLAQQYQSQELQRILLDPQYYEDNFSRAFSRIVGGRGRS
ncbi:MAG: SurA N-terminal domain-containing protein [Spirochaetota bacterium]